MRPTVFVQFTSRKKTVCCHQRLRTVRGVDIIIYDILYQLRCCCIHNHSYDSIYSLETTEYNPRIVDWQNYIQNVLKTKSDFRMCLGGELLVRCQVFFRPRTRWQDLEILINRVREEQDYTLTRQTAEEVVVVIQHQSTRALLTTKYTGNSSAILHYSSTVKNYI